MKAKFKNLLVNNKYIFLSGGVAFFIIIVVYFCYSIIPFGDKTIYRMDLYHQYGPLFSELYDRLTSGESLLYSWNSGLGGSFIGNLFNYLSSPFALLVLIFGHDNTFEAVAAMIAIKCILSSMSMAYYLKKSHKSNSLIVVAFGTMYAFCGYFIAFYWNVMWIDAMYLLPLIVLGIEKIINNGKCSTYIIFLSLAIFSNYYIGFMLCIFSCIYFLYYYCCSLDKIQNRQKNLIYSKKKYTKLGKSFFFQSGIRFALSSLATGIILLFMLLPVAYVLSSSSATSNTNPTEIESYFNIFDFLANHLASLEPTIRSSGEDVLPNIYCGMLTVILIPIYLFSNKICSKEKIASVCLLAFMFFSFNINIFNYLWHGLHFPNDLPYRQSFMYSFILITMAHKAFVNIYEFNKKHFLAIGIAILSFVVIAQKIGSKNVDNTTVLITIIFTVLFTIVLGILSSKKNQTYALTTVLVCSVIAETVIANTDHYVANQTKTAFTEDYDDFKELQNKIDNQDDTLFYRTELSHLRTRMDPSWYDYNGVSVFSSMAYEKVANLQKYIGLFGNKINSYTYNPQTPIYNSMFSIKYIYDRKGLISESDYYSFVDSNETYASFENNYMLNIAFPVSNKLLEWDAVSYLDPVEVQEEYFKLATGIDNLYQRHYDYEFSYDNIYTLDMDSKLLGMLSLMKINEGSEASITANITASSNGHIYIYISSRKLDAVTVRSNAINTSMSVSDGYILDLGNYNEGDLISVEMPIKEEYDSASVDFIVFTMDDEKFKQGYELLKSGQIEYAEFNETRIKGTFSAEENEILFTSIPYDQGWNVYIDGRKISNNEILKISDALLGINITPGEHEIIFEYSIPYMNIACIISAVFALFLIIIFILNRKKLFIFKNAKTNIWDESNNMIIKEKPHPLDETSNDSENHSDIDNAE